MTIQQVPIVSLETMASVKQDCKSSKGFLGKIFKQMQEENPVLATMYTEAETREELLCAFLLMYSMVSRQLESDQLNHDLRRSNNGF